MNLAWPSRLAGVVLVALLAPRPVAAYPTDEYARTGIRRLQWQFEIDTGVRKSSRKLAPGARLTHDQIQLRMTAAGRDFELTEETPKDPALQKGLEEILKRNLFKRYNVAVLDITDPATPRFAAVHENDKQTPGSVAKVLVGAGMLRLLQERFPDDVGPREAMLKDVRVAADDWAMFDSHEVPVVTGPKLENVALRKVKTGDTFTLWEWMDHALSASNNSAAAMLWREAMLMRLMGAEYPPPTWDDALFKRWDRQAMTEASFDVVERPAREAGLNLEAFNVYMYFTTHANRYIHAKSSVATPLAIIQWLVRMEQGRMVDPWSSLELKKMIYLTRRRVRYAAAPELADAAVFFKSGSLFQCKPEEGFTCVQYEGNEVNVLNALVEVETPEIPGATAEAPAKKHVYLVAVMSNELKRNAAADHGKLASEIHKLILAR
ncbi:MAG: hypothetical protein HY903_23645 [Deltaproteobacteria bacterium]|nr:hypothetical protein [Deltaproteobacteria bacterium]